MSLLLLLEMLGDFLLLTPHLCPQKLQRPHSRGNSIFLLQRHRERITPHLAQVLRPFYLSGLLEGHSTNAGDTVATHRFSCSTCALFCHSVGKLPLSVHFHLKHHLLFVLAQCLRQLTVLVTVFLKCLSVCAYD